MNVPTVRVTPLAAGPEYGGERPGPARPRPVPAGPGRLAASAAPG